MIGSWCLRFDSLCKAILALQIRGDQILCHSQPNITIPRLSPGCLGICINSFRPPKASLEIFFFQKFTTYWENVLEQLLACSFCIIIQSGLLTLKGPCRLPCVTLPLPSVCLQSERLPLITHGAGRKAHFYSIKYNLLKKKKRIIFEIY